MAEIAEGRLGCVSDDCQAAAVKFCKTCRQAFCATHNQIHIDYLNLMKASHEVITVEEDGRAEREENSHYCTQHQKAQIVIACQNCYKIMCAECIDDRGLMKQCTSAGVEQHETRSIKQVSQKIQHEMSDFLSELRIKEMEVSDGMKGRRLLFDEQMEANRDDLERLALKVEELHKLIDTRYKEWKETLVDHMTRKREMMNALEAEFGKYQKNCQEIHDRADRYQKQSDVVIVKDRWDVQKKLQPLMNFKLNDNPDQFTELSLKITDDPVKFPVSYQTEHPKLPLFDKPGTVRVPKNLEFKTEIEVPSSSDCVHYRRRAGCLLHAGDYQLSGLEFTPSLPASRNISLYEQKSSLYILQYCSDNYYHVHVVNLDNRSVSRSTITFPSPLYYQHMAVTDQHILIAHYGVHLIKVYSTTNYNHMFDIKDGSIFTHPRGLAVVGDTLVVGEENGGQKVVNITIGETPEVRWSTSIGTSCRSLEVKEDCQIILVGSPEQLNILSYQGEKLAKLNIPQCSGFSDFSTYENQLAVADETSKFKVYEMKFQEQG